MAPHRERLSVGGDIVRTHQPGAVLHTGQMHGERARHAILGPLDTGEHADEPLARRAHHHRVPERHQLVEPANECHVLLDRLAEAETRIEDHRHKMAELEKAASPDFDAIDAREKQLDWDMRIFQDRQQALTYVCETPVILEQRVFALARAIAAGLK